MCFLRRQGSNSYPENTRRRNNTRLMLVRRRRRWANIKLAVIQRLVFGEVTSVK